MRLIDLLLALLPVIYPAAPGDELVTRDGRHFIGSLLSWNREAVVFLTKQGETLYFAPGEVARLTLGKASVEAVAGRLPQPTRPEPLWKGTTDASYSGKRGTRDSDSLVLDFEAERRTRNHRLQIGSRYFYSTREMLLTGNQFRGNVRLDRFVSLNLFLFGSADFETNQVEKVDLRATVATGFGLDLWKSDDRHLSLSGGAGFTRENFTDGTERSSASGLFTQELGYQVFGRTELEQKLRYLQDLTAGARFKLRLESGLRFHLNQSLSLRIGLVDAYDHHPPAQARRNELTFLTGLGLAF